MLQEIDRTLSRGEPSTLLWAHYFDVHEPYEDTRYGTSDIDRYDGEINKADAAIDRLIRQARKRFTRELIIVVTADHGEEFREHGGVYHGSTLYEEQIRVPLIVHVPGIEPRRIAAPVETLALAPTVLGLVGVAVPKPMRGDDLRPLLVGKELDVGPVFAAVIHKRMVVRWPHKLIADLRFGLFELYDLTRDPGERQNLAGSEPTLRDQLRDEIYGWLDSLTPVPTAAPDAATASDPRLAALAVGRLGDRRAVQPLVSLAADGEAPLEDRLQATRMLGHLADDSAADPLATLLEDPEAPLAAEAAIALGRMFDARARTMLRRVVASEDPDVRTRAAVSLGRLRDRAAVPALIEALWLAPREYEREEAVRWLGRLGDTQALDPLLQILPESRTRHLAVVAIGRLRDPRTFDALADVLETERLADVRSATVQGLGYLGDPRAIELIAPLASQDASLSTATESLVRLAPSAEARSEAPISSVAIRACAASAAASPAIPRTTGTTCIAPIARRARRASRCASTCRRRSQPGRASSSWERAAAIRQRRRKRSSRSATRCCRRSRSTARGPRRACPCPTACSRQAESASASSSSGRRQDPARPRARPAEALAGCFF